MKIFEYLACGRPIVAPRSPDTADILVHDENAWLVGTDDSPSLVKELRKLKENEILRKKLAQGAKSRSEQLTWEARGQKIKAQIQVWLSKS